uniref:PNN interacting serine and arginine rich protein n=1 Tax=Myotis myotis TaxID=51298 RepID=A0A7J7WX01_MYOMY|nr:PNN interacting serine and arginine rich protein [Myotis myotis]
MHTGKQQKLLQNSWHSPVHWLPSLDSVDWVVMDQETVKMKGVTEALSHLTLTMRNYGTESGKNRKLFGEKKKNSSCYMINRWKKKSNKLKGLQKR